MLLCKYLQFIVFIQHCLYVNDIMVKNSWGHHALQCSASSVSLFYVKYTIDFRVERIKTQSVLMIRTVLIISNCITVEHVY